jgi:2-(1,2-epoxy-1,2-dihydrophenyl)acetyl-CoA isomerase
MPVLHWPDERIESHARTGAAHGRDRGGRAGRAQDPPVSAVELTRAEGVATLSLSRPDALNALDYAMMDALVDATRALAADDSVRVVVVRGEGRHFMAGGDIRTFAGELARPAAERAATFTRIVGRVHAAIEQLARMPHPVVARVQGACAGFGLSLLGACDLAIASDDAYFAAGYRNIGLSPDGGGTWSLPRLVGPRRAAEILLLGERFDAARALAIGLVNRVVPAGRLDAEVAAVAASLCAGPRDAIRATRRLLRESPGNSLAAQLDAEARSFGRLSALDDFAEGVDAFVGKRAPDFGGSRR